MVRATRLGKRFGDRWVFRRVEFCLKSSECLLVTGANGSGKSTLLRLVAGLEPPTEGSVDLGSVDPRVGVGYSAPELRLYPALTGMEHLQLAGRLRGVPSRGAELLELVGLDHAGAKPTAAFSTGMRVRLRLALAVQANPGLLILDEPSAGLDEGGISVLEDLIAEHRTRGAVVLATNDPRERRFGDLEIKLD